MGQSGKKLWQANSVAVLELEVFMLSIKRFVINVSGDSRVILVLFRCGLLKVSIVVMAFGIRIILVVTTGLRWLTFFGRINSNMFCSKRLGDDGNNSFWNDSGLGDLKLKQGFFKVYILQRVSDIIVKDWFVDRDC